MFKIPLINCVPLAMMCHIAACSTPQTKSVASSERVVIAEAGEHVKAITETASEPPKINAQEVLKWLKNGQKVSVQVQLVSIKADEQWWKREEFCGGGEVDLRVWIREDNGNKLAYVASNEGFEVIPIERATTEQTGRQYALFFTDQVETNDQSLTLNLVAAENDQVILPNRRQKLARVLDGIKDASLAAIEKNLVKSRTPIDSLVDSVSIIWLIPSLAIDGIDAMTETQPFLTIQVNLARSIFYRPYGPTPDSVKIEHSQYKTTDMMDFAELPIKDGKLNLPQTEVSQIEYVRHIFILKGSGVELKFAIVVKRNKFIDTESR